MWKNAVYNILYRTKSEPKLLVCRIGEGLFVSPSISLCVGVVIYSSYRLNDTYSVLHIKAVYIRTEVEKAFECMSFKSEMYRMQHSLLQTI